jgi:hypothetical protein
MFYLQLSLTYSVHFLACFVVCFDRETLVQASLIVFCGSPRPDSGQTLRPVKFRAIDLLRNVVANLLNHFAKVRQKSIV